MRDEIQACPSFHAVTIGQRCIAEERSLNCSRRNGGIPLLGSTPTKKKKRWNSAGTSIIKMGNTKVEASLRACSWSLVSNHVLSCLSYTSKSQIHSHHVFLPWSCGWTVSLCVYPTQRDHSCHHCHSPAHDHWIISEVVEERNSPKTHQP